MAIMRTLKLAYVGDSSKLNKANKEAETGLGKLGKSFSKFGKVAAAGALAAGVGAIALGKKLFEVGEEASTANARIETIAKSMDLFGDEAGTVSSRLVDVANQQAKLTGVSRTTIKETSALLLTFRNVAASADEVGGTFDRAQQAALDLAAAGFGSATSNAQSLGKALEDPIRGLASLSRQGVTFTEVERERIKTLVESNQIGEAQTLILEAIEKQVGGTAEATANASDRLRESFGVLQDEVALALAPAFEVLTDAAFRLIERLQELWTRHGPQIIDFVIRAQRRFSEIASEIRERVQPVIVDLIERFRGFISTVREWWERVGPGVISTFRTLRDPVLKLWDAAKDLWGSVRDLFAALGDVFSRFSRGESEGSGFETFIRILASSLNLVVSAATFVTNAVSGIIGVLQRLVESRWFSRAIEGLERIIDLWRRVRGISEEDPPALPAPTPGAPSTPAPRPPGSPGSGGGGGDFNYFTINAGIGDPVAIARAVQDVVRREDSRSGPLVPTLGTSVLV
jgi:prophage DNA circulation protein